VAKGVENDAIVTRELWIELSYKTGNEEKTLVFRRISYEDERHRKYAFVRNNLEFTAQEIALIY